MKAPRVFVDLLGSADRKNTLLTAEQAHHLKDVLRLAAGDPVIVVDRHSARSYHGTIGSLDPHISVIIGAELTIGNRLQPVQTLLFGLSKGQKNEL
ncbi:MAG: hypothetical protein DCC75_12195, partial [Proteobacteria bacterium]